MRRDSFYHLVHAFEGSHHYKLDLRHRTVRSNGTTQSVDLYLVNPTKEKFEDRLEFICCFTFDEKGNID